MAEKKIDKNTGEVLVQSTNAFSYQKKFEGESNFDKYYIDRVIKKVLKKIGPGESDYIEEDKVVETKRDIAETINADACNAGIEAYLAPYVQSKTPLPNVEVKDEVNDFTKCPETFADAQLLGDKAREAFNNLDPKLTQGKTFQEFFEGFQKKAFEDYLKSLSPQEPDKSKEGEK